MTIITTERYHDFSAGHRVFGHEGACALLHGHNYRVHFVVQAPEVDKVGRVLDFSVIKTRLCGWLEDNWDHRMLLFEEDPWIERLESINIPGIVVLPFNPTAENMAAYLLNVIGCYIVDTGAKLVKVRVEETRKCSATATLGE